MNALILPQKLHGSLTPPPSIHQTYHFLVAAALAQGVSHIRGVSRSANIKAMLDGICGLGADCRHISHEELSELEISGIMPDIQLPLPECNCDAAIETLRFLLPVALVLRGGGVFYGNQSLLAQALVPYIPLFAEKGISHEYTGGALRIRGELAPGTFRLRDDISPQILAGLLFALPLLSDPSTILFNAPLASHSYTAMTLDILQQFGITIDAQGWTAFDVPGNQVFTSLDATMEKDFSLASFLYVAQAIGNALAIQGMNRRSTQPESSIIRIAARLSDPGEAYIDVRLFPDLIPAIAVQAALREGEVTHILNTEHPHAENTDRLASIAYALNAVGGRIREYADKLVIKGVKSFTGGEVPLHGDYRIAMMLGIAATCSYGPIWIPEADNALDHAYPTFWEEFKKLGGIIRMLPSSIQ